MNTEDKFYFGKSGQPERFEESSQASIGQTVLNKIEAALAAGKTVYLSNMMKSTVITPKNYAKWKASGTPLFKVDSKGDLRIYQGGKYVVLTSGAISHVRVDAHSRPGQPERFAKISDIKIGKGSNEDERNFSATINGKPVSGVLNKGWSRLGGWGWTASIEGVSGFNTHRMFSSMRDAIAYAAEGLKASRPGQPERFDMEGACWEGYEPVGTKQKDGKTVPNCVPMKNAAGGEEKFSGMDTIAAYVQVLYEEFGTARGKQAAQEMMRAAQSIGGNAGAGLQKAIRTASTSKNVSERNRAIGDIEDYLMREGFARPGQPDTFDASSLERGAFAEASKSPMLGKLLAAKAMPDGGWRAVQVGSDTLVISFEDADLARDFGRRVASKGYSATSPVATTGRYWNVEVKNGK
jgi:hypothetical protein